MGNGAEEDVRKLTGDEASYIAGNVNMVTTALVGAINAADLRRLPPGHRMFGAATLLASLIRNYIPEKDWPLAVDAFTGVIRNILSSNFQRNEDGSYVIQPRSVQ